MDEYEHEPATMQQVAEAQKLWADGNFPNDWDHYVAQAKAFTGNVSTAVDLAMNEFHRQGYPSREKALSAILLCLRQSLREKRVGNDQEATAASFHAHWNIEALREAILAGPSYVPVYSWRRERATSGGNARQQQYAPLKEAYRKLLVERSPQGGWSSKAAAARALAPEIMKIDKKRVLSPENIERKLTEWLGDDELADAFHGRLKP